MSLNSATSIYAALVAERHDRYLAEAEHARRLDQLDRGHGWESVAARLMRTVHASVRTATARVAAWRAAPALPVVVSRRGMKGARPESSDNTCSELFTGA